MLTVGKDMSVHVTGADEASCIDKYRPMFQNNLTRLTKNWASVIYELYALNFRFVLSILLITVWVYIKKILI